jgi:hypothetical protein
VHTIRQKKLLPIVLHVLVVMPGNIVDRRTFCLEIMIASGGSNVEIKSGGPSRGMAKVDLVNNNDLDIRL